MSDSQIRLGINGLSVDQQALEKNWDEWKRLGKSWGALDRVYATEKQMQDLVAPLMNSDFSNSDTLLRPSIPEFTAIMKDKGAAPSTYVCFRKSLLTADDVFGAELGGVNCEILPVLDAYVYVNNQGAFCNMVITIAKTITSHAGHTMTGSVQFPTYRHDDPFTKYMLENDPEYFQEFARSMKLLYMEVQMLSVERPEVLSFGRESLPERQSKGRKGKKRRRDSHSTRFVRVVRIADDAADQVTACLAKRGRKLTCPCWGVAGHWRVYKKSGKRVWIEPYRKGRERNNPAVYQPKNYIIPEEAYS